MSAVETAWKNARNLYGLPDTKDARMAWYLGARFGMNATLDAYDDEPALLRMSDELRAFAMEVVHAD